jgi:hypothetical protein
MARDLALGIEIEVGLSLRLGFFLVCVLRLRFELVYPLVVVIPPPVLARLASRFLKRE